MSENKCGVGACLREYSAGPGGAQNLRRHQRIHHNMIIPTMAERMAATYTAVGIAFRDNDFGGHAPWWCVHCRAADPQMQFKQEIAFAGKKLTPKNSALKHAEDCPNRPR